MGLTALSRLYDQEAATTPYKLTPIAGERSAIISKDPSASSECLWQIGIQGSMDSAILMTAVLTTLRDLGYEWYNITPWRVRAQPIRNQQGPLSIILTIQLYKSGSGCYLIDTLISQGPSLPTLHAALQFLRQLCSVESVSSNLLDKSAACGLVAERG